MRIPEWAVTVWEKEAREREERPIGCQLFLLLFGPTIVLFLAESFSSNWGVWFSVTRIIVMVLQLSGSVLVLYITVWSVDKKRL